MVIEKRKGMKAGVVLAAMVVVIAAALVPIATATVNLDITPGTNAAGATTGYTVDVTTDGYSETVIIHVTIPAGFGTVAPTGPWQEIATAELYGEGGWYAKARFESNSQDYLNLMNVTISNGGVVTYVIPVDYGPGGGAQVGPAEVGGMHIEGVLKLPTETEAGYFDANVTLPDGVRLNDLSIDTGQYVQNPPEPSPYQFVLTVTNSTGYTESDYRFRSGTIRFKRRN